MVQVGGRFQLIRNDNFRQHLVALGVPEDRAKEVDAIRPILEIIVNKNEVIFSTISGELNSSSKLVFDEEVIETIALNISVKSTTTRTGNQINIFSIGPKGETGIRLFEFYDTEMIMTLSSEHPDIPIAKRYYQRL
ncbi:hypothetical protein NQ317_009793 [Molorchus minor]|uniref:Uncharacterized protein n=1 Tax=Molorchus minor TaxID=1323400 RepID=A0ABQ9JDT4_9CUCU|nr:hypothetical protein NQ317_009793 [Molorchus minor]